MKSKHMFWIVTDDKAHAAAVKRYVAAHGGKVSPALHALVMPAVLAWDECRRLAAKAKREAAKNRKGGAE